MKDDIFRFLSLAGRLPLRLDAEQVAWLLNCQEHDITFLIGARLLKPLGKPPQNSRKFFSTAKVLERCTDDSWLDRVSDAIHEGWRKKKSTRKRFDNGTIPTFRDRQCGESVLSG